LLLLRAKAHDGTSLGTKTGRLAMKFELLHALRGLEDRTPQFFKTEAIREGDETAKRTAIAVLSTTGDPKAVDLLREMLRLV
jgi:hypothetical protein